MTKKTAMQIVSERIESARDNFPGLGFDDEFIRGFNKAFQIALLICKEVGIEAEKQQIIEAAKHGADCDNSPFISAEDYFDKTYSNNETS
jgi:hypothetical protein